MKQAIHPKYETITVTCSCGNKFETGSTLCRALNVEVRAECHPFYTGKQKVLDAGGQIHKFNERFGRRGRAAAVVTPETKNTD